MLTQKERFRVTSLFLGIFLVVIGGIALFRSVSSVNEPHYEKGAFVAALSAGAFSGYAPWLLLAGGIALLSSFLLRDK